MDTYGEAMGLDDGPVPPTAKALAPDSICPTCGKPYPICPLCSKPLPPGVGIGLYRGEVVHIRCWRRAARLEAIDMVARGLWERARRLGRILLTTLGEIVRIVERRRAVRPVKPPDLPP
jgi:hypothetical protein